MENEDTQFFVNSFNALGDISSVLLNFLQMAIQQLNASFGSMYMFIHLFHDYSFTHSIIVYNCQNTLKSSQ